MTNLPSETRLFILIVLHLQLFQGFDSREPEEEEKKEKTNELEMTSSIIYGHMEEIMLSQSEAMD